MKENSIQIHSFKHDKNIHRIWETVYVVEENDDYIVAANNRTRVIESDGKFWTTKEPAICYFFKKYWFNVIGMLKQDGIHYYCNLASPSLLDDEAIKYVDYDLDVKVTPDWNIKLLDQKEYEKHSSMMNYPDEVKEIVEGHVDLLIDMIKRKVEPFKEEYIYEWYEQYERMYENER